MPLKKIISNSGKNSIESKYSLNRINASFKFQFQENFSNYVQKQFILQRTVRLTLTNMTVTDYFSAHRFVTRIDLFMYLSHNKINQINLAKCNQKVIKYKLRNFKCTFVPVHYFWSGVLNS